MDRQNEKVKVTISTGTSLFYYIGYIIDTEEEFFIFDDLKEGRIKLNRNKILSIKDVI